MHEHGYLLTRKLKGLSANMQSPRINRQFRLKRRMTMCSQREV